MILLIISFVVLILYVSKFITKDIERGNGLIAASGVVVLIFLSTAMFSFSIDIREQGQCEATCNSYKSEVFDRSTCVCFPHTEKQEFRKILIDK